MRLALIVILVSACSDTAMPAPTETACPDPDPGEPSYASFGQQFMTDYCVSCHNSQLPRSQRHGAPLYHDFDSLLGVVQVANHIDEESGIGPAAENFFMPPARCPSQPGTVLDIDCPMPTEAERRELALWIACEMTRPH